MFLHLNCQRQRISGCSWSHLSAWVCWYVTIRVCQIKHYGSSWKLVLLTTWECWYHHHKFFYHSSWEYTVFTKIVRTNYIISTPRFLRIGSMILALHDASDLILELAKLCKYSGRELSASICFGLFATSWFFLRMVYFPFWVIKSSRWYFEEDWNYIYMLELMVYFFSFAFSFFALIRLLTMIPFSFCQFWYHSWIGSFKSLSFLDLLQLQYNAHNTLGFPHILVDFDM